MKKVIVVFLVIISILGSLCACGNDSEIAEENNAKIIYDFEDKYSIGNLYYLNFDKITHTTDERYVSQGKGSYYLFCDYKNGSSLFKGLSSVSFYYSYSFTDEEIADYTDKNYLSADIYSPYDEKIAVAIQINGTRLSYGTLSKGWNNISCFIDREELYLNGDDRIERIKFYFDNSEILERENFGLYIDNLKIYNTASTFKIDKGREKTDKEIYNFDTLTEISTIEAAAMTTSIFDRVELSISDKYVLTEKTSLLAKIGLINRERTVNAYVKFNEEIIGTTINRYIANENAYLRFNVYNDSDVDVLCCLTMDCNLVNTYPYMKTFIIPARNWVDSAICKVRINDFYGYFPEDVILIDIKNITFNFMDVKDGMKFYFDKIEIITGD